MQPNNRHEFRSSSLDAVDDYEHELEGRLLLEGLYEINARLMSSDVWDDDYRQHLRWVAEERAKLLKLWQDSDYTDYE